MRLGIDYRLLASRENLVNRGIGRYTQHQLREVLRLDHGNEYLLLCPSGADTSLVLPEIRAAANVSFCLSPPSAGPPPDDPYDRRGLLRRSAAYQDWVHGLGVDLYHSTAPFVLEQTAPPAFDACPMVATVYDFIPLIFPDQYLRDAGRQGAYAGAARLVSSATRLIAISDGTRDDAANYLGYRRDAIDCAWPYADALFRPLDDDETNVSLRALHARVGLPDRFVLTVAALHYTKNLELLFAAYALLSPSFRRSLPLVVSCHVDEVGAAHVRRWAATFGVADDVVITGYVSDVELAGLYSRATLVVHPSRYEGFGLPVVEAMQCGAAVITTTGPSMPEVTAGAAVLVDPDDAVGLAVAVEALAADGDERRRMGEMGVKRASAFTPEALGRDTLASYHAALVTPPLSAGTRVGVCTPCRPSPGDAAGHALDLLSALPARWDVEVFTDDPDGPVPDEMMDGFPVHHVSALARVHARRPFDIVLYNAIPVSGDLDARSVIVDPPPLATSDPCGGRPRLEALLARARLGWRADRLTALVLDPTLVKAVEGRAEVAVAVADPDVDDDRLVACDVVVATDRAGHRLALVRAAAAGKPLLLSGSEGEIEWPASFADRLTGTDRLAARLAELADDPDALRRRARAARAWFEAEADADQIAAFYDRLLGHGEPPPTGDLSVLHRALADHGVLTEDARVLSLGSGGAELGFRLTREVGEVTVAGAWLENGGTPVSRAILVDPALMTTAPFDPARLVIRHADLRRLPFPDGAFHAVVAWGAMDELGDEGVARAMAEVARVTRPGGVVVLSVAVRLHGRTRPVGVTLDRLVGQILPTTGLEPVGEVPQTTGATRRAFSARAGAVYGPLHLTLRKR